MTVDFSDGSKIRIVCEATGTFSVNANPEAEHTFRAEYTLTAKSGTLEDSYALRIGGENATLTNGKVERA